jgi:hypothetical protein
MTTHDTDPHELGEEAPTVADCPIAKTGCQPMATLTNVMLEFVQSQNKW